MKPNVSIAMALFLVFLGASLSAVAATTANEIQSLVLREAAISRSVQKKLPLVNGAVIALEPDSNACVDEACRFSSCDLRQDALDIAKACGSNTSGGCVRESCNRTGCEFKSDLLKTIRACQGNASGSCVQEICSRIGCNFGSETHEVAQACKTANGGCVKSLCEKTGCSLKSNAFEAIEACADHQAEKVDIR